MSDIKRFLLRIPEIQYEALELEAIKLGTSLNRLIVERLKDAAGETPRNMKAVERTRKIAACLPNTFAASDLPVPKTKQCPECGALNGIHQRKCTKA